ncbi:bifunctional glycosyltransferase/CDP-glycerol:glycerophosphate glycerophosphotransferase [Nocardioides pantholopis]|uniref:bifunctional glycosyltransferase/CDP-glycerol:glycerophosphate glycerophosphotransferase n=1 Tax=Nocardioides pantholopis TaxID=2483798 RepID=UPI000FD920F4|nr:CDP-glycerol glycerophosphotransferase family protein [Nocardioides pantholopis]
MRARQRVTDTLRKVGSATPRGIRGPLGRASRRFRSEWTGPRVTVVLAVSDADTTRIGPCLDSLREQLYRNLEIRVHPWGPCAEVRRLAREHADADWRVIVAREDATDAAAARNAGARAARGGYLLFVAGGDNLPIRGIGRLVDALETSGSDFAVGRMRMPMGVLPRVDSPFAAAHQVQLLGTDLATTPVAVTDLGLGNRMFRRTHWRESGLRFTADRASGVDVALASYARSRRFDLLAEDTYVPTNRRDGVSVGSMPDVLAELDDWLADHEQTWRDLTELDLPAVRDWWLWGVLDTAIQPFIDDVERADDDQWRRLREHVELLLKTAGESAWTSLQAQSRVKLWLLRHDRRAELEDFVVARLFERGSQPTLVLDGTVVADLPFRGDAAVGVPDECYLMTETETPLVVDLRGVRWTARDRLELDLLAYVDHVDLTEHPEVAVALVGPHGARIPLPVRQYVDPTANQTADARAYQDFSRSALVAEVDAAQLARESAAALRGPADATVPVAKWRLDVEVRTLGLTRRGGVTRLDDRGSAGMVWSGLLAPRLQGDLRVGPVGSDAAGFAVEVRPVPGPRLVEASVSGRRVRGALRHAGDDLRTLRVQMGSITGRAPLTRDGDLLRFDLEVPRPWAGRTHVRWELVATTEGNRPVPVAWTDDEPWLGVGAGSVVLSRSGTGDVDVLEAEGALLLDDVTLQPGRLEVAGRWLGTPPRDARLVLAGMGARQVAELGTAATGGAVRTDVPLTWDQWGLGERPLPRGRYLFELDGTLPPSARVLVGAGLVDRLLDFTVAHGHRFRPLRNGTEAGVQLLPALTDAERGLYAQSTLQRRARATQRPVDPGLVYLQSYSGASATDSQLAIHAELRRRHPELRVRWGVVDSSSWVPEGAEPVLMHSAEWYDVLTTAGHLCLNIDFDRWFAKRPEQRVLQTFHGYPAKSMGIRMWEAKGYTPRRIALELDRTSRDWDLILTPAPEMDEYYRREYRYDGAILSSGYPRDDALVGPDAASLREQARARLGIAPGQKAVLYAPTWRDDLATTWRNAELVAHLDVETASNQLGPDYVMLMRGHRFHQRPEQRAAGTARMVDVSDYPEINDLILASDAAILDYSSLRFDFALTRRPMIFLVPDLATYTGGVRGFLYPFEDSAPGPLVDTADEVIDRLRRLPQLEREYAAAQEEFHSTYNYLQDGHSAQRVVEAFWG